MTPRRWREVEALFDRCVELPDDQCNALLDQLVAEDFELVDEVRSLLANDQEPHAMQDAIGRAAAQAFGGDALAPGLQVGPYRLQDRIGEGGMGSVWLALRNDQQFDQRVAIKFVSTGIGTDWEQRFLIERQILARLEHPHIARLLDGGEDSSGRPYLVMEYVDGEPLTAYCDQRVLDLRSRMDLFLFVCEAVDYAHAQLVVHRDLKPANILVNSGNGPKLLDFGIAKLLLQSGQSGTLTRPQQRLMTPDYASPEQLLGKPISTAADVYSLGVVFHELLCGIRPPSLAGIHGDALNRLLDQGATARPSAVLLTESGELSPHAVRHANACGLRPAQLLRSLRGDLDTIVAKAMHPDPQRRYRSVALLSDDIRRYLDGRPVLARPDGWRYRLGKRLRRQWQGAIAAVLIVALSVAFVVNILAQSKRLAEERDRALIAEQQARAVTDFLVESFQVADPGQARGESVTVRELIDAGSDRIASELEDQPQIQTELMATLGDVYLNLGLYDRAEQLHRDAYQRRSVALGSNHPETVSSADRLGDTLREMARYDEADSLLRAALAAREQADPPDWTALADSLNNLGLLLRDRGQNLESEPLLRRAVAIRLQYLGPEHDLTNVSRVNLALSLRAQGELEEATELFRTVLDNRRRTLGDHYKTAVSAQGLATILIGQGKLDEAEPLLFDALRIYRTVLPPQHPHVGNATAELAYVYHDRLRLSAAEQLYSDLLQTESATVLDTPDVAYTTNNYAALLLDMGELDRAESLYRRSLAIREQLWGEHHSGTLRARSNLAELLRVRGRQNEAELLILDTVQRQLDEGQLAAAADSGRRLALLRADQGRHPDAVGEIAAALQRLEASGRATPGKLAVYYADLARLQADADIPCSDSMQSALIQLDSGLVVPLQEVQVRVGQGICQAWLGQHDEARETLLAAREQWGLALDNSNRWIAEIERRLVDL